MIELLLLVVFVIGLSLALYKISLLSTKETSFEEAISNQHIDVTELQMKNIKKAKEKVQPRKIKPVHSKNHVNANQKAKAQNSNKNAAGKHETDSAADKITYSKAFPSEFAPLENMDDLSMLTDLMEVSGVVANGQSRQKTGSPLPKSKKKAELDAHATNTAVSSKPKHKEEAVVVKAKPETSTTNPQPTPSAKDSQKKQETVKVEKNQEPAVDYKKQDSAKDGKKLQDSSKTAKKKKDGEVLSIESKSDPLPPMKPAKNDSLALETKLEQRLSLNSETSGAASKKNVQAKEKKSDKSGANKENQPVDCKKIAKASDKSSPDDSEERPSSVLAQQPQNKAQATSNGKERIQAQAKQKKSEPVDGKMPTKAKVSSGKQKIPLKASDDWLQVNVAAPHLLSVVQKSKLSEVEVQSLIDALLNKQGGSPPDSFHDEKWVTKADPVTVLKKQLEETEAKLAEKTDAHNSLSARIVDLRSSLNEQIVKNSAFKKQLEKSSEVLQQKLDESSRVFESQMTVKTNELRLSLEREYQTKLEQSQKIAKDKLESQGQLMNACIQEKEVELKNAQNHLILSQSKYAMAKQQLEELHSQHELVSKSKDEALMRCHQFESAETSLGSRNDELNRRLEETEARLVASERDLAAFRSSSDGVSAKLAKLAADKDALLKEAHDAVELRKNLANTQVLLKSSNRQASEAEAKLLLAEKEALACRDTIEKQREKIELLTEEKDSIAAQMVRPAADGQENGDLHPEEKKNMVNNHFTGINEESVSSHKEISRLKEDNAKLSKTIAELKSKCDSVTATTRSVLLASFPSIQSKAVTDHDSLLKEVSVAAADLSKEKTPVEPKIKTIEVEKIVEKVVPDEALLTEVKQLRLENKELKNKLAEPSSSVSVDQARFEEELNGYKEVLRNTESLLRTLQKSVEEEEKQFQAKIQARDKEIERLVEENQRLTLQSDLQNCSRDAQSEIEKLRDTLTSEEKHKSEILAKCASLEHKIEILQNNSYHGASNGVASDEIKSKSPTIVE